MLNNPETSRADKTKAWQEGLVAAKEGKSQSANPYIGKNSDLAKNWDEGWKEAR